MILEELLLDAMYTLPSQKRVKEFVITSEDTGHGFHIPAAGINAAVPQQSKGELRVRFIAREKGRRLMCWVRWAKATAITVLPSKLQY